MKKLQFKLGIFAATITVLIISMGNLPIATAGINVPGTLTIIEFCDLQLVGTNMVFGNQVANSVAPGSFDLENVGTGVSTADITGAGWFEPGPGPLVLDVTDTSYEVNSNAVTLIAFTGGPQNLGDFEGLGGSETVDLSVSVTPTPATFTGPIELTVVVTENTCAAA